jgi:hypothetical protein
VCDDHLNDEDLSPGTPEESMKRFVVIATVRRGAVEPHEPVEADLEMWMFERMWAERGYRDAHVEWGAPEPVKLPPRRFEPSAKAARMMELAERIG